VVTRLEALINLACRHMENAVTPGHYWSTPDFSWHMAETWLKAAEQEMKENG